MVVAFLAASRNGAERGATAIDGSQPYFGIPEPMPLVWLP
jgi:hypothetical protein